MTTECSLDYEARAIARIIWQYRNSPKFTDWVTIVPNIIAEYLEKPACEIIHFLDIDRQSGSNLDIIGEIVAQDRPFIDGTLIEGDWFGWKPLRAGWLGTWLTKEAAAGGLIPLPDAYYRVLLKSKIAKNTSDATIDSIDEALEFITGDGNVEVVDNFDMTFEVTFSEDLDAVSRFMVDNFDIVPRPQGVKFLNANVPPPDTTQYFGYIGDPLVTPYGVAPYKW